jgi:hypothetical protein
MDCNSGSCDEEGLSFDAICDLVSDERRRAVISSLRSRSESIPLSALATDVIARERDASLDSVSAEESERVGVSLHHRHLPKLDRFGVVAYDPRRRTVEKAPTFESVASTAEALR